MNNLFRLFVQLVPAVGGSFRKATLLGVMAAMLLPLSAAFAAGPVFTVQPTDQTVTPGATVKFTVTVAGTGTVAYQWKLSTSQGTFDIVGATTSTLTVSPVKASDAGTYTVVATDSSGSTTSHPAILTVVAPIFVTQPQSQTFPVGFTVTFTAAVYDSGTPTYQWQKGGVNISGATGSSYSIAGIATSDAGDYTVVASNSAGAGVSNPATLTVTLLPEAPVFTTQPAGQAVPAGTLVTFTAAASGSPAPTFQWFKGTLPISGATDSSYSLGLVSANDAGDFTVVATNGAGFATSSVATLTITAGTAASNAAVVTTPPVSQTVTVGASVRFSAAASGNPAPTFQWLKDSLPITGATGSTYIIPSAALSDAGSYSVVATNTGGAYSSASATLTVLTTDLSSQTVTSGHNVSFFASNTTGTVQWQVSSDGGTTWTNLANSSTYSGVATARLAITSATSVLNTLKYRYVATDGSTVTTSAAVSLKVTDVLLPFPTAITTNGGGTFYVTDAKSDTVQTINAAGQVAVLAGTSGTAGTTDATGTAARFNQPAGVALLSSGGLVVADTGNGTLRSVTSAGIVTTLAGSSGNRGNTDGTGTAATFASPIGITLDSTGTLYVADAMNNTVRKVASGAAVTTLAGGAGVTGFVDGNGTAARFNYPTGAAVDASGNVFVSDTTNNTIRKITPAGDVTTFAGVQNVTGYDDGTGSAALFDRPGGLTIDGSGNLYLADTGNSTIRRISPDGVVSTIAGLPTIAGQEDGVGINALFNHPQALTLDAAGNLYVADTGNASIRKVDRTGVVTTLALTAAPTVVTPPTTPVVTPPVTPPSSSGGGGGAPSIWFLPVLLLLGLARRLFRQAR